MLKRLICAALLVAGVFVFSPSGRAQAEDDGIVRVKSAYDMTETLKRLKKDVADKGIVFFSEIDQAKLAADAGVTLLPSTSAIRRSAPCSSLRTPTPGSTGRSDCSSIRMPTARCG